MKSTSAVSRGAKSIKWLTLGTLAVLTANTGTAQPPDRISSINGGPILGHLGERRTNTPDACVALPGNPLAIDERSRVIEGLSLQDLIDTGVVDCENSATDGELFQFYSFRSEAPGSGDVDVNRYKVADFVVDVVPPEQLVITSPLEQTGLDFVIEWETPSDVESISFFGLYASNREDPSAAVANGLVDTAPSTNLSASIRVEQLDLVRGDEVFLYVAAID